uniref:Uncharacterized protein n=2 Tax=Musa acuminata subsp. malaccensis TaxID=214687 RepID=A0A804HT06_MUSAM
MLSGKQVNLLFFDKTEAQKAVDETKAQFGHIDGDHLML